MIAHFASYTPLLGHRFVKLFARLVKYFGPLACFPVPAAGTAATIVTPVIVLHILCALLVTGHLLLLTPLLCLSQCNSGWLHSGLKYFNSNFVTWERYWRKHNAKKKKNNHSIPPKCILKIKNTCLILLLNIALQYKLTIRGIKLKLTSSRTYSYGGGGELGIVCSFLAGKQFLSVSVWSSSVKSSVPEGNDWLICRCCSSDSTLLLRLLPELRDFSIFEKRSLKGASLTSFFVPVVLWERKCVFICKTTLRGTIKVK